MVGTRVTNLDKISYLFNKNLDTINDESDIEKYTKTDMKCVSRLDFDVKLSATDDYIKSLLYAKFGLNNKTILVMNCNNKKEKRNVSVDMAISFATINKKVLLIVTDPIKIKQYDEDEDAYVLKQNIKKSAIENLDIFVNSNKVLLSNEIISQLKKKYDIVIIDTTPYMKATSDIGMLTRTDYTALVVNPGETKIKDLKRICKYVKTAGENIVSIVLNKNHGTKIYDFEIKNPKSRHVNTTNEYQTIEKKNNEIMSSFSKEENYSTIYEKEYKIYKKNENEEQEEYKDTLKELLQIIEESKQALKKDYVKEIENAKLEIRNDYRKEIANVKYELRQEFRQELERYKLEMQEEFGQKMKENKKPKRKGILNRETIFSRFENIDYRDLEKYALYEILI